MKLLGDENKTAIKNFFSKHSKAIIITIILLLLAIPLGEAIFFSSIQGLFSYLTNKITTTTGVNTYLAKGIVLALMIPLLWSLRWMFSFKRNRRRAGYAVVAVYLVIFYLSMFVMTKDQKFDFSTGKAIKFYAETPEGIRYFDAPGFDPKYGIELKPVDPGVARSQSLNMHPLNRLEQPDKYFDPATMAPLVWYYEGSEGIELYDQPGFHPKYGVQLLPVTQDIVIKYERQQEKIGAMEKRTLARRVDDPAKFFDSRDGSPMIWYYESAEGIELFDQSGYHPTNGAALSPITPIIVDRYKAQQERIRKQKDDEGRARIANDEKMAAIKAKNAEQLSRSANDYSSTTRGMNIGPSMTSASTPKLRVVYANDNFIYYVAETNLRGSPHSDLHIYLYEEFNKDVLRIRVIGDIKKELANGYALHPANSPGNPDLFKYQVLNIFMQQSTKLISIRETLYIDSMGNIIGTKPANDTFILDVPKYQALSNAMHGVIEALGGPPKAAAYTPPTPNVPRASSPMSLDEASQKTYPPSAPIPQNYQRPTAAKIINDLLHRH